MKVLKKEEGFTLIEVVSSIVIITIVLLSFSQLFIQSNKTAAYNNEKLVAINMAEAELERLKLMPFAEYLPSIDSTKLYNFETISDIEKKLYSDGDNYRLNIKATQTSEEKNRKLINIVITVKYRNSKSTVEGYIRYE
ncbi:MULTISPECIES: type IV pilus modification PilV family protein [Solibacillus]|uniref:Prepilin-type N-terminal cleavage/methylation domain-containing protein n=1 Tax=Solibacillus merdavium TaxID=2762218 RepID=A0ABR8XRH1_9BACL|nr:prepilin-type N-terminal cleavage/methylation domain-containing protein [Solibacillus merdavium]MBD8034550.1 prepilin-type N-terminal cleavage/methylation domain-containing protein [Solibacillus merdavium]